MRTIGRTIIQGLLAVLPVGLTIYLTYWMAQAFDRVLSPVLEALLPKGWYVPGFGLIAGLILLYGIGLVVNAWLVRSLLRSADEFLARIPVVKTLYVAIRDFTRFFPSAGDASDMKRVVLVPVGPGKALGFVTAESSAAIGGIGHDDLVAVYLPMSYMVGGYTLFLPRGVLEPTTISVEAAMRLVLMGGVQGAVTTPPMVVGDVGGNVAGETAT